MSQPVDHKNISKENEHSEKKFDMIEKDLPLGKLLKISKSFKTDVDKNLSKFKKETMSMINDHSGINCTIIPVKSNGTIKYCEKQSHRKFEEDSNVLFRKKNCNAFNNSKQELINEQNSLEVQNSKDEYKLYQSKEQCCEECCVTSIQYNNEKISNFKKIFEVENKCQHWMDKYNELHNKYFQLEYKFMQIEKENNSYQMEIARIKIIEEENLRLNQIVDKSNHVRKELESALESCHEVLDKYHIDMEIARSKVKEAIEVVEKTHLEKDRLEKDLINSHEELTRLETTLNNLMDESGKKVYLEVEKIKTIYKNKLCEANDKTEFLRTEKQIECNKALQVSREYEILKNKYKSLNQKYKNELDLYSKKEALLVKKIKDYEITIANLTANVKTQKESNMKLQERNRCSEDNYKEKNVHINELKNYIEAHKQIVAMWRRETYNMIEGFKHKIIQLKQHSNKVKRNNNRLKKIMNNSKSNYLTFIEKKPRKTKKLSDFPI